MRYGVLSDIHGNYPALQAAVHALRKQGVDQWLCAGDIVGYGPQPNECVETVAELGALCVTGNHELLALGELDTSRSGSLCRMTTGWTRGALRQDTASYIAGLPQVLDLGEVVLAHGSLTDPEQYVRSEPDGLDQLRQLADGRARARVLVLGHTHRQWAVGETGGATSDPTTVSLHANERVLVNPGAVGQSRQREVVPLARFAVLDTDRDEVRFSAVAYDVAACRAALRAHGLPVECVHVRPGLVPAALRRSRRLLRSAIGADRRIGPRPAAGP
jgi:predicted phosphodiesterase